MVKLKKRYYITSFLLLGAACLVILIIGTAIDNEDVLALVILPVLAMYIIGLVFHYRAWKAIQDGFASTTPAKSVAYLFIPLFNIYWLFRTLYGYANDFNEYISRHDIEVKKLPILLYFYQCVLIISNGILVRLESEWAGVILFFVMVWIYINALIIISKTSNGVNALAEQKQKTEVSDA
jgi:hypothetical protein